jgi:hypothetical protein
MTIVRTNPARARNPTDHRSRITTDRRCDLFLRLTRGDPQLDLVPLPIAQPPRMSPPLPPRHTNLRSVDITTDQQDLCDNGWRPPTKNLTVPRSGVPTTDTPCDSFRGRALSPELVLLRLVNC